MIQDRYSLLLDADAEPAPSAFDSIDAVIDQQNIGELKVTPAQLVAEGIALALNRTFATDLEDEFQAYIKADSKLKTASFQNGKMIADPQENALVQLLLLSDLSEDRKVLVLEYISRLDLNDQVVFAQALSAGINALSDDQKDNLKDDVVLKIRPLMDDLAQKKEMSLGSIFYAVATALAVGVTGAAVGSLVSTFSLGMLGAGLAVGLAVIGATLGMMQTRVSSQRTLAGEQLQKLFHNPNVTVDNSHYAGPKSPTRQERQGYMPGDADDPNISAGAYTTPAGKEIELPSTTSLH